MTTGVKQSLPNPEPRPPGELEKLERIWSPPKGFRIFSAVNNTIVGLAYLGTAFLFFLLAGLLALLMRTQLAVSDNDLVGQTLYNQLFTVHGTTMMFLFAVPAIEALGMLLLPQMLAARDLPFPRLSAYAFWAYFFGGMAFFSTVFYDLAPAGGWFMYPPLTLDEYSPGINADFWLLGIGFIEISAIAGAVEILVGTLRTRPPGMSLDKLPVFGWTMLIFATMIVFAFPAVILATLMLELERAFGWPFFGTAGGGDPLLWQHLFWFFGHPEVYIIFLPAAGMVSMIVPTMARTPLVGYRLIVISLIGTGFLSFGLWVHHMFTTGLPALSLGIFSALSMAVAVPAGIQVFAWIATIARARGRFRINTPSLFVLGFLFIFTLGGLTGVMVALVPFDWQVHDSYFVVAHFHYVLVGGMVFPLFGAFYYWAPSVSRQPLSEKLGRAGFWLMFVGFNLAFLTMHVTGLLGMPRRVWTYGPEMGWDALNFTSTVGAFVLAAGIAVVLMDMILHLRLTFGADTNPWDAGTLEWLPTGTYSTRSIPHVTGHQPLWEDPSLTADVEAGHYYLPDAPTGGRETLVTTALQAEPEYVMQMPGYGWAPFVAAFFTAGFFLLLTVKLVWLAMASGVIAIAACFRWAWDLDPGPAGGPVRVARNLHLPVYATGITSHSGWAMIILVLVAGALYLSWIFSYLYLWTVSPEVWAPVLSAGPPEWRWAALAALLAIAGITALRAARRQLADGRRASAASTTWIATLTALGSLLLVAAVLVDIAGQWKVGLRPSQTSYAALVYLGGFLSAQLTVAVALMGLFVVARHLTGRLDRERRATLENTVILATYAAAQMLTGLVLMHGFPRLVG